MPNSPNTIQLEVSKGRLAADLLGLIRHLGEAATQGALLQNWPNMIMSLFGAAGTIEIKRSEGALAWQLLLTGIGEALAEVANQQPPTLVNKRDVATISKRVQQEATDLIIPVDFLDHPLNLPPVVLAKNTLLKWLAPPADSAVPQDLVNLERRFDSALVLGLHRAIRGDEAHYRPLLDLREDPTSPAWQMLEDWRLYRAWLEQFSFRCIEAIAGGADIVSTLGRREGREGRPHRRPQGGHRARRNGPQAGFEFGKDVFNRIEVGAVGGQVEQVRPSGLDRGAHASHFMAGQIVHHDPVARVEGGDEHLFDIGHKAGAIDWAVQDRRGGEAIRS